MLALEVYLLQYSPWNAKFQNFLIHPWKILGIAFLK